MASADAIDYLSHRHAVSRDVEFLRDLMAVSERDGALLFSRAGVGVVGIAFLDEVTLGGRSAEADGYGDKRFHPLMWYAGEEMIGEFKIWVVEFC